VPNAPSHVVAVTSAAACEVTHDREAFDREFHRVVLTDLRNTVNPREPRFVTSQNVMSNCPFVICTAPVAPPPDGTALKLNVPAAWFAVSVVIVTEPVPPVKPVLQD
jgi:hypothetical protein